MYILNETRIAKSIAEECWQKFPAKDILNIIESVGIACLLLIFIVISVLSRYGLTNRANNEIKKVLGMRSSAPEAIHLTKSSNSV
jgi:uncharacterized membrane protein